MAFTESYNQFFREAAVKHKQILHNVLAETPDGTNEAASFFIGIDKAINGIRNQNNPDTCTLILLKYELKGRDNGAYDYRANYTGAFIICKNAETDDSTSIESAETETEEVAWDIVNRIIQGQVDGEGLHCDSPFGEVSLDGVRMTSLGLAFDKQYGWVVEFDYLLPRNTYINADRINLKFNT